MEKAATMSGMRGSKGKEKKQRFNQEGEVRVKRILGIVSSQRKTANGEILLKAAAAACGEAHTLELVRLPELKLEPCRGCYVCLTPGKACPIGDDLDFLAEKIANADGIIWAAPCYALGPAAVVKLFGDRIIYLAQRLSDFAGKPCALIATAGIEGWEGYTLSSLTAVARFLGLRVKDSQMFMGALPGEALTSEQNLLRIEQLGRALFGTGRTAGEGECPTCWSDIWKFPAKGLAVCPYCGQEARLVPTEGGIVWEYGPAGTRFTAEHLQEHFQVWLKGKVSEFAARRKELAVIRNKFKQENDWLKPKQTV